MNSSRTLPAASRCSGLVLKSLNPLKSSNLASSRALSVFRPSSSSPNTNTNSKNNDGESESDSMDHNIIRRRFFHQDHKFNESKSPSSTKYLAAIVALGGGALYHELSDKRFMQKAYCEGEEEEECNCGCKDKDKNKNKEKDQEQDGEKKRKSENGKEEKDSEEKEEEDEENKDKDKCPKNKCGPVCVPKKCENSYCIHKLDCEEDKIRKANCELTKCLLETKSKAVEQTEAAMLAYCEAIAVMEEYINEAYCLIDSDELETPIYEEAWCCLHKLAKKRCEKVKEALIKGQCAWALLCKLEELVERGKTCMFTSCNPLLPLSEEILHCGQQELLDLKMKMEAVSSDSEVADQFGKVIEFFKLDLLEEVNNLPQSETCDITFIQQERAFIINLAYNRILKLQKVMAHHVLMCGNAPEKQKKTMC